MDSFGATYRGEDQCFSEHVMETQMAARIDRVAVRHHLHTYHFTRGFPKLTGNGDTTHGIRIKTFQLHRKKKGKHGILLKCALIVLVTTLPHVTPEHREEESGTIFTLVAYC